ncbi:hypothetical protein ACFDTO_00605 [Microbacteriaceae bacterium 4G12]
MLLLVDAQRLPGALDVDEGGELDAAPHRDRHERSGALAALQPGTAVRAAASPAAERSLDGPQGTVRGLHELAVELRHQRAAEEGDARDADHDAHEREQGDDPEHEAPPQGHEAALSM